MLLNTWKYKKQKLPRFVPPVIDIVPLHAYVDIRTISELQDAKSILAEAEKKVTILPSLIQP